MYADADLDAAVAAGVLNADSAAAFRAFVAGRRSGLPPDPMPEEGEHFRLLSGFNDIFVSIAAILILVAVGGLGRLAAPAVGDGLVAAASWALGEYLTRRRRMALPSLILLLSFVGGVFALGFELLDAAPETRLGAGAALATLAAYIHWKRFMVPVTLAAGACAALATVLFLLLGWVPDLRPFKLPLLLLGGLAVFALAMRWDMTDRDRRTRRSDVAFWLHLAAAPLIVHPAFAMLGLLEGGEADVTAAILAVAIYLALALVALAVDRRALLVSALFYVFYAMSALFRAAGSLNARFALTALVIGSALLLLSAFWHPARRAVIGRFPPGIKAQLPAVG